MVAAATAAVSADAAASGRIAARERALWGGGGGARNGLHGLGAHNARGGFWEKGYSTYNAYGDPRPHSLKRQAPRFLWRAPPAWRKRSLPAFPGCSVSNSWRTVLVCCCCLELPS